MKTLGSRLKKSRENSRLTQVEVAKKLGISNGTLSGYERDYRDPDTEILRKLAELYHVDIDWLLTGREVNKTLLKEPSAAYSVNIMNDENTRKIAEAYFNMPPHKRKLFDDLARVLKDEGQ